MRTFATAIGVILCCSLTASSPEPADFGGFCAQPGSARARTTLYFGLTQHGGAVAESKWRAFLRNEVTPRFPDGLTVWQADGQWRKPNGRITRERAKVLLLVHQDTAVARKALADIVTNYKRSFAQKSVLWEAAPVCAAF